MRSSVVALALAACAYQPGSYRVPWTSQLPEAELPAFEPYDFPRQRVTLGCVDFALGRDDWWTTMATGPVIEYAFGNRCEHRVALDLGSVRVVARDRAGNAHELRAYDPHGELRPLPLIATGSGVERIEYRDAALTRADDLPELCADVARVVDTGARGPRWLCTAVRQ
jgi:hypothetical protein